jgi:hypothetical protein
MRECRPSTADARVVVVFRTPVDPVSIPHDIEKRGNDRKRPEPNPEVIAPIPLPLQVTRSTGSTSQGGDTYRKARLSDGHV